MTHTPPDPSTRRRKGMLALIVVAAVVVGGGITLVLLALVGMLGAVPTSSDGGPVPVVESTAPAVALPDGETFGYITEIGAASLTVDPALLLTGNEARAAAEEDGVIGPGEDLPNDFYIRNAEPGPMVVGVAPGTEVTVLTFDAGGSITEVDIPLADLAAAFTGEFSGVAIYGLVAGEFPVNLYIDGGTVEGITQVYLP